MKTQEAVDFVISELGKHHSQDRIISDLCDKTGMPWSEAAKFVKQVAAEHGHSITVRESPLVVVIGIQTMIVGIGLIIFGGMYALNFFHIMQVPDTTLPINFPRKGGLLTFALFYICVSFLNTIFGRLLVLGIGVLLVVYGSIKLLQAIKLSLIGR